MLERYLERILGRTSNAAVRAIVLLALAFLIGLGLIALVGKVGFSTEVEDYRWWFLGGNAVVAIIVAAASLAPVFREKVLRPLIQAVVWLVGVIRTNWQLALAIPLIVCVGVGAFSLTQSAWAPTLGLGLVAASALFSLWLRSASQRQSRRRFQPIDLRIATTPKDVLKRRYADPPLGTVEFNGVEFVIEPGPYFLSTKHISIIESDGTKRMDLELPEAVERVKAVHLLINASGARKEMANLRLKFEWSKIGSVELGFTDGTVQATPLILGSNIRDWAVAHRPGALVDRVDDPASRLAWKGTTVEGKHAIIDQLEIPVTHRQKGGGLRSIAFVRDLSHLPEDSWRELSRGPHYHFFVSAITLELE